MKGQISDVWQELRARKIIWAFVIVIGVGIVVLWEFIGDQLNAAMALSGKTDAASMQAALTNWVAGGVDLYTSILVFLVVLITAGNVPGMLQRGRAEFYLAKPVSRVSLFSARFDALFI
ncbi:MAG: hypothetical protein D6800_14645, partial [Candidatus Zixiibacteriota bacterium]